MNKVILAGNVGGTPTSRTTPSGQPVANFSLATSERFNRDGTPVERTQWHKIVCWGRLAETVAKHLTKGRLVLVEGRLQTRTWEDRDGVNRLAVEIVAGRVEFLGGKPAAAQEPPVTAPEAPPPTEEEAPAPDTEPVPF